MARGSVFKKPNNMYAFRVDLGPDPATGKRRQHQKSGFRTKKEAEKALTDTVAAINSGFGVNRASTTLEEFLEEWLPGQRQRLKETTWSSYRVAVDRISARIGRQKLQALTPMEIESFYRNLAQSGSRSSKPLKPKSIRNTHVVLRKALADAERLGIVTRNAAAAARPPTVPQAEYQTWSAEDLMGFFRAYADDRFLAAYILSATTGMRRGEVLGLRWTDVDLDRAQLAVVNTLTTVNYQPVVSTPKTKRSRRVVYLDGQTVEALRKHREQQGAERTAAGPDWDNEIDLVFRDELGRPVHPDWFSKEFTRKVALAKLPKIRLHDLRHTYATLALKQGVHPKIVSERLGHATVGITLDLYSHVTPAIARDAADVVADRIFGATGGDVT